MDGYTCNNYSTTSNYYAFGTNIFWDNVGGFAHSFIGFKI